MSNALVTIPARLPMPPSLQGMEQGKWRVLCESIFPTAKTAEAVMLAIDYCKARNLDILKKPVNIVPMWSSQLERYVETVWPSINEVQITASRTGKYAGMDEPKWGPDITKTFEGIKKTKGNGGWKEENLKVAITYPEWCAVTVYRLVGNIRCAFTEPVYWLEAYARNGKTEVPNDMWAKRPRGQFLKVAKAFSLRAAFPEEGTHTAEEMEGKVIEEVANEGMVIENTKSNGGPTTGEITARQAYGSAKNMKAKWTEIQAALTECKTHAELENAWENFKPDLATLCAIDQQLYDNLVQIGAQRRKALDNLKPPGVPVEEGGLTDEELRQWESEQERDAAFSDRAPYPGAAA